MSYDYGDAHNYIYTETLISESFRIGDPENKILEGTQKDVSQKTVSHSTEDYAKNYVYNVAMQLCPEKSLRLEAFRCEYYGIVAKLTTDLCAREALNLWLKMVRNQGVKDHKIAIEVEWLGANDVNKNELMEYLTDIMLSSGTGPRALAGFNAVADVRELRGE
jgi:hypothetical protein